MILFFPPICFSREIRANVEEATGESGGRSQLSPDEQRPERGQR